MSQFSTKPPRFAKLFFLLVILALVVFPIGAVYAQGTEPPPPPISPYVTVAFIAALTGVAGFFITQGFKSLSALAAKVSWLSWINISGWGSVVTTFIVNLLLVILSQGIELIPAEYHLFLPLAFEVLTAVLTAIGLHLTVKTIAGQRIGKPTTLDLMTPTQDAPPRSGRR